MATVTHAATALWNTTAGTATNKAVTATPAAGDLIVVIAASTGLTGGVTSVTDSNADGLGAYTQVDTDRTGFSTTGVLTVWVRNALVGSATSTVFTAAQNGSTGGGLDVFRVSGMTRTGAAAVRQSAGQSAGTSGTTPAPVMGSAVLTGNPVIGAVCNGQTTAGSVITQRTGYTEASDLAYSTPGTGLETMFRSSGETSTTLTWGSTSGSAFASAAVELDTTGPEDSPPLEASGFGAPAGISPGDTIVSVTATINQWASTALMAAPGYQLWDYSAATPAQIGATVTGTVSTSTANTDTATWTGVTFAQLPTLRVRVLAHSGGAGPGATQSVDYVSLSVAYTPATVTMLGPAGTFGASPVATRTPSGWGPGAGEGFFYATAAPDGQVVLGTITLMENELDPTADHAEAGVYDPARDLYYTVPIPTSNGTTAPLKPGWHVGGTDVGGGDMCVVTRPDGTKRVLFTCDGYYFGWQISADGLYPAVGYLQLTSGNWAYDQASSKTADQIETAAPSLFAVINPAASTNSYSESYWDPRGINQVDVTPSGYVITGHYFPGNGYQSGVLTAFSPTGQLVAAYQIPSMNGQDGTTGLQACPREIKTDPSSPPGDERFIVIYDCFAVGAGPVPSPSHVIQEFSFSSAAGTITPKSVPCTGSAYDSLPQAAAFDAAGNLWLAQGSVTDGSGLNARAAGLYLNKAGGRNLVTAAPATGSWATNGSYATKVAPDYHLGFGRAQGLGLPGPLGFDRQRAVMFWPGWSGLLGTAWATKPPAAGLLGTNVVPAADSTFTSWTGNWSGYVTNVAQDTTAGHGDSFSLKITAPFAQANTVAWSPHVSVTPGTEYLAGAWFSAPAASPAMNCDVKLLWYDGGGTQLGATTDYTTTVTASPGAGWVQAVTAWPAPPGAVTVQVQLDMATVTGANVTAGTSWNADDVTVQAQPFAVIPPADLGVRAIRNAGYTGLDPGRPAQVARMLYVPLPSWFSPAEQAAYGAAYVPDTTHPQYLAAVDSSLLVPAPPVAYAQSTPAGGTGTAPPPAAGSGTALTAAYSGAATTAGTAASLTVPNPAWTGTATPAGVLLALWPVAQTTPTTWTCTGFTAVTAATGQNISAQLLWRISDGTEGATFTLTPSVSRIMAAVAVAVSAEDTSAPFDPAATSSGQLLAAVSSTLTATGVTTTRPGDLLIWLGATRVAAGTTAGAITPPAGFTALGSQYSSAPTSSANVAVLAATETQGTAAATGDQAGTTSVAGNGGALLLSVSRAPAGTTVTAGQAAGAGTSPAPAPAPAAAPAAGPATGAGASPQPSAAKAVALQAPAPAGTGTAPAPSRATSAAPAAGLAAGTGTSPQPSGKPSAAPAPAAPAGTGQAPAPAVSAGVRAGLAAGQGAAPGPALAASTSVSPAAAGGGGTAPAPAPTLAGQGLAGPASGIGPGLPPHGSPAAAAAPPAPAGTGTAPPPAPATAATAGLAAGSGQAPAATPAAAGTAGAPAGAGQAPQPAIAVAALAGQASGAGQAPAASASAAASGTATARLAAGTGTATAPAPAVTVTASAAAGTGQAPRPAPAPAMAAQVAAGNGQAPAPAAQPSASVSGPSATGTGQALQSAASAASRPAPPAPPGTGLAPAPQAATQGSGSGTPGAAPGAGLAPAPAGQAAATAPAGAGQASGGTLPPVPAAGTLAGSATGTGQAPQPAAAAAPGAAAGTGTGTAPRPSVSTIPQAAAQAGTAAGDGQAPPPAVTATATARPGQAPGAGTAAPAASMASFTARPATATGTAPAAGLAAAASPAPGPAAGTGTAPGPGGTAAYTVTAGPATATGNALAAALALAARAQALAALGGGTAPRPQAQAASTIALLAGVTASPPRSGWASGPPQGEWAARPPGGDWAAGTPAGQWDARPPASSWAAGSPQPGA